MPTINDVGLAAAGLVSQPLNSVSGYKGIAVKNYDVDTFTVDTMGDVYIRKSLVIGNDDGGADEIEGELEVKGKAKINTSESLPREGLMVNGDIHLNAGVYPLRFYKSEGDLGSDDYTFIARGADGATILRQSGGNGPLHFLSLNQDFIAISNDNAGGEAQPISDGTAVVHVYNGLNTQFGTNTAQLGNVAPLNDWSCYPARV